MFGSIGNEEITTNLLEAILNTKIYSINLNENPFTEKDLISDKLGILDIKTTLNNSIPCDIEMQIIPYKYLAKRILFYWAKLFTSSKTSIKSGDTFEDLKKTIVVLFTDFNLHEMEKSLANLPDFHTIWHIHEDTYSEFILSDVLEIHIISLKSLENLDSLIYNEEKDLINWIKFIKNPNHLEANSMDNKYIKEAKEQFDKLKADEHEQALAESRMKYIIDMNGIRADGYDKGYDKGKEDGQQKRNIEIAKNLLKNNVDIQIIMNSTGLSKKEIENLNT